MKTGIVIQVGKPTEAKMASTLQRAKYNALALSKYAEEVVLLLPKTFDLPEWEEEIKKIKSLVSIIFTDESGEKMSSNLFQDGSLSTCEKLLIVHSEQVLDLMHISQD